MRPFLFADVPSIASLGSEGSGASPDRQAWSVKTVETVMQRHPLLTEHWDYTSGLVLKGIEQVWRRTDDERYFAYIKDNIDHFVEAEGRIRTYRREEYNLDQINSGKVLFMLYSRTKDERYRKALYLLREQLRTHPRTSEGGFWHKKIYPHQMWLDGIYMAAPFYAEFARNFGESRDYDDIVKQVLLVAKHTRDPRTGLFYHGWDESRSQIWADRDTGCSPHFWGRAIGWYAMALVDVLDFLPEDQPLRGRIIEILQGLIEAVVKFQDPVTGLWYQLIDRGMDNGNYPESSASCMFVYAIAKSVKGNYVDHKHLAAAQRGYEGILHDFVECDCNGLLDLKRVCKVAGLGGKGNRDGSFAYYLSEPVVTNDFKGVGAFILASVERGF